ncbi:MAG: nucleotide exchange factor GrpE [Mahellales bacterium]|jgi:molecular chaperone GrpE
MESNNERDGLTGVQRENEADQNFGDTQENCDNANKDQNNEKPQEIKSEQDSKKEQQIDDNDQENIEDLLAAKEQELSEYIDLLKRLQADFDNYRKRTSQAIADAYNDSLVDVVAAFLPVLDNLERAVEAADDKQKDTSIREGIIKIHKQFKDVLGSLGVTEIEAMGCQFDPQIHNAVMQQPKEEGNQENEIVEVFQKGYQYKGKVIRYSMVKVVI